MLDDAAIGFDMMQMPIMKVVDVVAVLNARMFAPGAVLVIVIFVRV
ncbi:hypothetical protein [Rubripirellula amarantea]|nr:hypothetical protein [Rubripirellula amarantea]